MKVKELIEKLEKLDENKEVVVSFNLDSNDEIGYYLEPVLIEGVCDSETVYIYSVYTTTKEDCDFIGQVDLKEAYQRMRAEEDKQ